MKYLSILGFLVAGLALAQALSQAPSELGVQTSSGLVHGIYNDSTSLVRGFLGIPYAEPPIDELRFAQPRRNSPLSSPINASAFSKPCPQATKLSSESILNVLPYTIWDSTVFSEDCLYLNVWAPASKHTKPGSKAAVMIFIHGGDFGYGGTSISYYDGTNIVRDNEDVIVVTLNYRLNFFGFPNAPGLEPSRQNPGLQDQRLAIEWVYENIAHFGGDPERMILFGQSVGAASADIYAHAVRKFVSSISNGFQYIANPPLGKYPENPLVKGIIMQSGTYMSGPILRYQTNWERLSNAVGCGFGEDSINCMKKVPLYKIVDAMAVGEYSFLPVPDGSTYFADYKARAKSGKIAKLPVLAGFDEKELAFMYPLSMNTINESEVQADTQASFNCPLLDELRLRSENDIPIWRYVYQGNFSNLSPRPWLGAYHTFFGTYNVTTPYSQPASRLEIETSRYMQGAWVAFAKDPQSGLQKYGWPQFNDKFQEDSLVKIGGEGISSAVLTSNVWDQYCNPPLL